MRILLPLVIVLLSWITCSQGAELPLFDAHIHYNHDAWEPFPAKKAIALLRDAGVLRALVSSANDDGTQKLYEEAPDLIIPELCPYRKNGETDSWFRDESIIPQIEKRLSQYKYVAIGEFHVYGENAELPVIKRIVHLAKKHDLLLHAHSDAGAVERLFREDPKARVVWAHAGFEKPSHVRDMLRKHDNLWVELSSRDDVAPNGRLSAEWRTVLMELPDRFMVGTDTHPQERWNAIDSNAKSVRGWLRELPQEIAERIAYKNGEIILTSEYLKHR